MKSKSTLCLVKFWELAPVPSSRGASLNSQLGIECITYMGRRSRLPWSGHTARKDSDDCR